MVSGRRCNISGTKPQVSNAHKASLKRHTVKVNRKNLGLNTTKPSASSTKGGICSLVRLVIFVGATSRIGMFRLWGIGNPKTPEENDEVEKKHEATGMQPNPTRNSLSYCRRRERQTYWTHYVHVRVTTSTWRKSTNQTLRGRRKQNQQMPHAMDQKVTETRMANMIKTEGVKLWIFVGHSQCCHAAHPHTHTPNIMGPSITVYNLWICMWPPKLTDFI